MIKRKITFYNSQFFIATPASTKCWLYHHFTNTRSAIKNILERKIINTFASSLFALLLMTHFSTKSTAQVTQESGDLFVKISNIISAMPGHTGDDYADPGPSDLATWSTTLDFLLNGDYDLADASAATIDYDITQFLDTSEEPNKTYYVLEATGANYWGTYVYYPDYCRPLVIQSPHPKKDLYTGNEGIHIFIETQALFFCLSGTSRCNSSLPSSCTGTTSICSVDYQNFRISDLSHTTTSIFQSTTEILFNDFSNTYFVQLHGFAKYASDPYVILSNGTQITPDPDYLVPLSNHLYNEDNVLTFKIAHVDLDWTRLRGFYNTQGRLINSSADVCNSDATTTSGRYLNIELEKSRLRDDVTGWDKLANALKNTFTCYTHVWEGSSGSDWSTAINWRNNTVPTANDNITISNASNSLIIDEAINSPAQCNHLEIQSSASVTINAGKAFTVNGKLNNSGTLTIKSNALLTGSLIVEGEITGIANIERYIDGYSNALHGWHFLASPVNSQAISEFHTPGSGNDFYKWDEVNNIWVNRTAEGGDLNDDFETEFESGCGYLMANTTQSIQTFSGVLQNTDVDKPGLTYTNASENSGWHLLGNPFSSSLVWNNTNWALTNIDAIAKIWVESSASYLDIPSGSGLIPAMQGFMVHVNTAPGSLTIDAADRSHHGIHWYKNVDAEQLKLVVHDVEGNTKQECLIKVNPYATTGFDPEFDSRFLAGYAPQFYSVIDDGALSTNTLPEFSKETVITFEFIKNKSTEYYFEIEGLDNFLQDSIYLSDLKTGHTHMLSTIPNYAFHSDEGDSPGRFLLHFSPPEKIVMPSPVKIDVFSAGNEIHINSTTDVQADINCYSVSGQLITKTKLNNSSNTTVSVGAYNGIVMVSVIAREVVFTKKVIVW